MGLGVSVGQGAWRAGAGAAAGGGVGGGGGMEYCGMKQLSLLALERQVWVGGWAISVGLSVRAGAGMAVS